MYLGYTTLLLLLVGLGWLPRTLWRSLRGAASLDQVRARLSTRAVPHIASRKTGQCLWFHAASVGEVQGVQPILAALHQQFPAYHIVLSTFTPTGQEMARRVIPEANVFLLPIDLPWLMRRAIQQLRPRALIVQETELWPHLFRAAARQQVPVVLVNGRLSRRSVQRYAWVRPLMQQVLTDVALVLTQTVESAQRFQDLGAPARRVRVVGNTNIDRALLAAAQAPSIPLPMACMAGNMLLVGGSTHEGEETLLLSVYQRLRQHYPTLRLVLAPRHVERAPVVMQHVQACQLRAVRRSQCHTLTPEVLADTPVIVLDTLGELAALYSLCTVAFVGGSLVPIGGHNILEPAVYAKPVLFGPHMHHFPELAALLCAAGGAMQVPNAEALYGRLAALLEHPEEREAMGRRAFQTLAANRGALERTVQAVTALLTQSPVPA